MTAEFSSASLLIDAEKMCGSIEREVVRQTGRALNRRGVVLGVSGGVDSSVCLTLACRALGPDRVVALLMPEYETESQVTENAADLCRSLGVSFVVEAIGSALESIGCYQRRDDAIREIFPEYGPGYRQKVTIASNVMNQDRVNYFNLTIQSPSGEMSTKRMSASVYSRVVAATNMKQRTRKMIEYFYAESRNFAVLGTPNRLEYELGFFVRGGDGLADLKPIAHLYKTQVYSLGAYLGVPESILTQAPSTDTYTLPQTQEEFYFAMSHGQMDLMLWAWNHEVAIDDAALALGLETSQVERVYRDIQLKRRAAARGLAESLLVEPIDLSPYQ